MRTRRAASSPPLLLLSFQDIMTAVTAIVLLCMLSLAIDLLKRGSAATVDGAALEVDELRRELAVQSARRAELQRAVERDRRTLETYFERGPEQLARQRDALRQEAARLEREIAQLRPRQAELHEAWQEALPASEAQAAALQRRLEAARRAAEQYGRKAAEMRSGDALVYNPASAAGRRVWLVDLAEARIVAVPLDAPGSRLEFRREGGAAWRRRFRDWVRSLSRERDMVMVLIRPSGIEHWNTLQPLVSGTGCPFGYDVIGEHREILISK